MQETEHLIITDIGSTTTKALLLKKTNGKYKISAVANSPTTVEKPNEDVCIGLYHSLKKLEEKTGASLIKAGAADNGEFTFNEKVSYFTTSSAGGGLQILVVGLSLMDSASSAKRAAFGAGGVILETIAVNDNRTAVEQIGLIDLLRPDIILFSGGVEGGAYASVIRMSEILKVSNPKPKFGVETKVPLIYAGNSDARHFVRTVFGDKFDLHFVENIRPAMQKENLEPARDEIHRIFMDNVMEQAPGYVKLKDFISDKIIPTPTGVLRSMETFSKKTAKKVIAFDLGGATTDIFSSIFDRCYRTVSANYGMSYSIANVMADAGFANIKRHLPQEIDDNYIRNYICNKMLYPTYLPQNDLQQAIEHAAAKEAIAMSCRHHLSMNFNIQQIGHLDRLKEDICKFQEAMYYEKSLSAKRFFTKDFDIILAAGGLITGASDSKRTAMLVNDALNVEGITEIWSDAQFLSPHLGKLSEVHSQIAEEVLLKEGYRKLALSVKPLMKPLKKKIKIMKVAVTVNGNKTDNYDVYNDDLVYIDAGARARVRIECLKKCMLHEEHKAVETDADVPLLIDTRKNNRYDFRIAQQKMNLFNIADSTKDLEASFSEFIRHRQIYSGKAETTRSLPYPGELYVKPGEEVNPDKLLGEVKFEPPRLFILSPMTALGLKDEDFKQGVLVKEGEEIRTGQKIFALTPKGVLGISKQFESTVHGVVEKINWETGSLYVREVQDYPVKPLKIKIASRIGIKPKQMKGYLKKRKGDFVRTGETLAKNIHGKAREMDFSADTAVTSPTTGTITDINTDKGTLTIQYLKKSIKLYAGIPGKITAIKEDKIIKLEYEGTTVSGIIGFGKEDYGKLAFVEDTHKMDFDALQGKIVALPGQVDFDFLQQAERASFKGLIIPSINNAHLMKFTGKEIGVALTGSENIPFPIIITEGFGSFPMHQDIADVMKASEGKDCFLQTFTQIRAGVSRPKIIITG